MTNPSTHEPPSPWHAGEVALQKSVGVADRMEAFGRKVIRDHMPEQHRDFYRQLPFVALSTVDPDGNAWATLIAGEPGFASSPDARTLEIAYPSNPADPANAGLCDGDAVGMLGIELHTRRRNRVNGSISRDNDDGFVIRVEHAFGNCPQYIQLRNWRMVPAAGPAEAEPIRLNQLDEAARAIIAKADTFFVASYVDRQEGRPQVDTSHRGGKPGFMRIGDDGTLTIPDFAGNLHFNTLGNLVLNPRAGLVFVDFENGDVLQLSGDARVILDSPEIAAFQGAERLWTFAPRQVVLRRGALPLRWDFAEWSPNSLMTGSWEEAAERLSAERLKASWRPFRVTRIVDESSVIRSFHLEPADGAGIVAHRAGQHLPIRFRIGTENKQALRTYTLSTAPSDGAYRISVKRQGLVSKHLHDTIVTGDIIEARAPAGGFTIDANERRPAVLIAAGVGVTPMLAMLRHIVYEGLRTRRVRPTIFFYAARSKAERAFDAELAALVAKAGGAVQLIRVLGSAEGAAPEVDYDAIGRIDTAFVKQRLGLDDYDFYMCGPPRFMQELYDGLRDLNLADERIHAEAFGPASLKRRLGVAGISLKKPAEAPVSVIFARSGKEARWEPKTGPLLDLAEARGLSPEYSCRGGSCGTCRTRIMKGAVTYEAPPAFVTEADEALICCAVPAKGDDDRLVLDL
jgi:ferredoxin-NADP reductase/predicted pyridoxine 5'-phosphate oxidase superfamily flavin-nucleotide-binding protein